MSMSHAISVSLVMSPSPIFFFLSLSFLFLHGLTQTPVFTLDRRLVVHEQIDACTIHMLLNIIEIEFILF